MKEEKIMENFVTQRARPEVFTLKPYMPGKPIETTYGKIIRRRKYNYSANRRAFVL